jgi:hypothetical protein
LIIYHQSIFICKSEEHKMISESKSSTGKSGVWPSLKV